MSDHAKVKLLETENSRLLAELRKAQEVIDKLQKQRDAIYWEYESIRYALNEQISERSPVLLGKQEGSFSV